MYIKDKDGNYVPTPSSKGADGREVSLRVANNYIQWRYPDTEWTNLVALSELKGEQGDKGTVGAHFTPSVSDDGVLSWTNNGGLGNPQPVNIRGPQGVQGEQGRGFTILGYYDTLAILQSSVLAPNGGDAYGVGTTPPYEIYIWDAVNGQWKPNGKLSGPNEVTTSTATNLTGLLKGNGTSVVAATAGTDYATPDDAKPFVVTFTWNSNYTATADKTIQEIIAAYETGRMVLGIALHSGRGMHILLQLSSVLGKGLRKKVTFTAFNIDSFGDMFVIFGSQNNGVDEFYIDGINLAVEPASATALPDSGTALTANTLYNVSAAVGTYSFTAPATGWAHGIFTTGTTPNITFTGKIIGKLPTFAASKQYEFDVLDGAWVVQEVLTQ